MIPWVDAHDTFPPPELALRTPNGLLCAGGDLSPQRILAAYRQGIFPWFSEGAPILWWSPDPRMTLEPSQIRISRSLRKTLSRGDYEIRIDSDFVAVIEACAATPRKGQHGTWITAEMCDAYTCLHRLGYAHSVETWIAGQLVGGLYGLAIGRMFYGESMFSRRTDASKIAFAHLIRQLQHRGIEMIDCQMKTDHLASLGGQEISRADFLARLTALTVGAAQPGPRWQRADLDLEW